MTTIPFSLVDASDRARTVYSDIDILANLIETEGLIQPLVLTQVNGKYKLLAGGRRHRALALLGTETLYHGTTSVPGRPGYVLADEGDLLRDLKVELSENLGRQDMNWIDEMNLIVKAWRLECAQAEEKGIFVDKGVGILFGASIGKSWANVQSAQSVWRDYQLRPERYVNCTSMASAFQVLLKAQATEVARLAAQKSFEVKPLQDKQAPRGLPAQSPQGPELSSSAPTIALTQSFLNISGLDFMSRIPEGSIDHIVTDPDYGLSVEALEANNASAAAGVAQASPDATLAELAKFFPLAWRVLRQHSFLVFWYDVEHHEKLAALAIGAGFRVQRWPLIWHKTDYRSNAAPSYNFCKNIEYAMVCRKPGATLTAPQMSSVFACASGNTTRQFNHPFAKPLDLWAWIYRAVAIKGQIVYDPFMGSGTAPVAALRNGLRPIGTEVNPDHYTNGLFNLQQEYRQQHGGNVSFT